MSLENIIHEQVLAWKRFGFFKLTMITSFSDACFNAYKCLADSPLHRDHTFFAVADADTCPYSGKVEVQFNYRINAQMEVHLISCSCMTQGAIQTRFAKSVFNLPSYRSIMQELAAPATVGKLK